VTDTGITTTPATRKGAGAGAGWSRSSGGGGGKSRGVAQKEKNSERGGEIKWFSEGAKLTGAKLP